MFFYKLMKIMSKRYWRILPWEFN